MLFPKLIFGQVSYPNEIKAYKTIEPIRLDGVLDEDCWQKAQRISNFQQRETDNGAPATEPTFAAVAYTSDAVYIACWCYDSNPNGIVAKHMKRDFPYWTDDNFEVVFDSHLDRRNGRIFVINPNGARADVLVMNDGRSFNIDWNGVWDAATTINEEGWFGEIEIPFSTLKYPDKAVQIWGANFERNIRRRGEQLFWQGWSLDYDFEHVSHAGTLVGLENIRGKETLELKPFATAGVETAAGVKPKTVAKIGGDANYLITPTLKLNMTANTDFAQVESDREQINLSRFSLYFPEKREFFLEGQKFYEFNLYTSGEIFYSRNIGLHNRKEVPIIGGARFTGKAGGTNLGFLSMQTAATDEVSTTNYSVLRLSQDLLDGSSAGIIATAKNSGDHYNYVFGGNANYYTAKFLGDKRLSLLGSFAQSLTNDSSGSDNSAYYVGIIYPNKEIEFKTAFQTVKKKFNPEMGFMRRKNYKYAEFDFEYNPRPGFLPWARELQFNPVDAEAFWTDDTGELETLYFSIQPLGITFKSLDAVSARLERNFDRLDDDFEIKDGIVIPAGGYWMNVINVEFSSFQGRNISGSAGIGSGQFYGGIGNGAWGSILMSLSRNLMTKFEVNYRRIELDSGAFDAIEPGGRIDYAFDPKTNATLVGQWNNANEDIILNFRFSWIPKVGSDFYFVVNQRYSTDGALKLEDTVVLTKFVWRIGV